MFYVSGCLEAMLLISDILERIRIRGSVQLTNGSDRDLGLLVSGSKMLRCQQCCGSRSGIRCLFDPWIRDPGWVDSQHSDPGSAMNNPDHIF